MAAVRLPGDHCWADRHRQPDPQRDDPQPRRGRPADRGHGDVPGAAPGGAVVGPAVGGLLLAGAASASSTGSTSPVSWSRWPRRARMPPLRPRRRDHGPASVSVAEGLRFVKGHQPLQGSYIIDINAMVFGMPRALFPGAGAQHLRRRRRGPRAPLRGAGRRGAARRADDRLGRRISAPGARRGRSRCWCGARPSRRSVLVAVAAAGARPARRGRLGRHDLGPVPRRDPPVRPCPTTSGAGCWASRWRSSRAGRASATWRRGRSPPGFGNEVSVVSGGLLCVVGALVSLALRLPRFRDVVIAPDAWRVEPQPVPDPQAEATPSAVSD